MNKHLINLCQVNGAVIERQKYLNKIVQRAPGALSFEIDGTFHRSQDLLHTNNVAAVALSGTQEVQAGTF